MIEVTLSVSRRFSIVPLQVFPKRVQFGDGPRRSWSPSNETYVNLMLIMSSYTASFARKFTRASLLVFLEFPNHVYRLWKAMYGLKQAPYAWFHHLDGFFYYSLEKAQRNSVVAPNLNKHGTRKHKYVIFELTQKKAYAWQFKPKSAHYVTGA